jgi:hypothetical protein
MVYIYRYIPIYKSKYVYVHIRVRHQLEYMLKSKNKKREMIPFSLGWLYQPRLKGVGAGAGVPPFSLGLTGTKGEGAFCLRTLVLVGHERSKPLSNRD